MFGFELFESPQGVWEAPNSGDAAEVTLSERALMRGLWMKWKCGNE